MKPPLLPTQFSELGLPNDGKPWTSRSFLTKFCREIAPWFAQHHPHTFHDFLGKRGVTSMAEYERRAFSTEVTGDGGVDEIYLVQLYTGVRIDVLLSAGEGLFIWLPSDHADAPALVQLPWPAPRGAHFRMVFQDAHWGYLGAASSLGVPPARSFPPPSPLFLDLLTSATDERRLFGDLRATRRKCFGGGDGGRGGMPAPSPPAQATAGEGAHRSGDDISVLRHNPACRDAVQAASSAHDASGVIVDSVELADDWAAPACDASVSRPQQHVARASALCLRGGGPPLPGASDEQPTTPPEPLAGTLPGCLLTRAECQPDATFVEVWDEHRGVELRVSFAQMANSMLAAMQWLRKRNFDDGNNCAILAHNSVEYISLSFGAMALGGVAVHLNWRQPESVTRQLLLQSKPAVVLASALFLDAASRICCEMELAVASLEEMRAELAYLVPSEIDKARIRALDPTSNAVVFFTGGTTGTPKPIQHTHDNMLWLAHKLQTQVPNAHHAGTLCFTPFFHVMGFCANLIFNMHAGVRAFVLASHSTLLTASLMVKACFELEPSVLNTIPHIVEGLCHLLQAGKEDAITALGKLQLITYGGAALSAHCSPIMVAQGLKLIGTYGQTEVSGLALDSKPDRTGSSLEVLPLLDFAGCRASLVWSCCRQPRLAETTGGYHVPPGLC